MEESTEMEVEAQVHQSSNLTHNHPSLHRFGLKNSIQTNFGDDYVFQIVPNDDLSLMAVSLSNNVVKLYSPVTGQYYGNCKGHSAIINNLAFEASTPHVLHSCSSDGTIRAWDTRTFQQVACIETAMDQEVFSFSFGGSNDNLLAGGCRSEIIFWDWRNKRQVACLEESHTEDVTQVHFVPEHKNKLVSASEDGLICIFNTDGHINDDNNLESVINVGTSIGKVGFFGDSFHKLWCLTHIETLSVWDLKEGSNTVNVQNARALATESWMIDHVDYFVDCYSGGENLWVIGGSNSGTIGYFPVNYTGAGAIGSPEVVLGGGHTDIVRSVLPISSLQGGPVNGQGIFGWSGGEDGRLCCWTSNDSAAESNRSSWISTAFVMRSPKTHTKKRHNPY